MSAVPEYTYGNSPVWPTTYRHQNYDVMVFTENGHYYAMTDTGNVFCIDSPTACIQEAINYVINSNPLGGKVYIRRGVYNISPNAPLQSWAGQYMFIGINPNPGQTVVIEGDGPNTIINIPTLSVNTALFHAYNTNCPSVGYQSPRVHFKHFKIVNNNTNSSAGAVGILYGIGSNNSSPFNPNIEDVEVFNPQNTPIGGIYAGVNSCSNSGGSYDIVIDNYRHITLNQGSTPEIAIGIDTVSHALVSNSFLYSSAAGGAFYNTAFWNGTGEFQIVNTAIYGFKYVFSGAADDGLSSYIVSNSIIGLNRGGYQTIDGSSPSLLVNGGNGYLIGGLSASGSTLHVLISNSHIDFNTYTTLNSSQPANIYLKVVNSEGIGAITFNVASGTFIDFWFENNSMTTDGCGGIINQQGASTPLSGRAVFRNNYLYGSYCYVFSFLPGLPGVDFIAEDNIMNVTGLNASNSLGTLFYHNGANRYIVRRNRIYLNNGSSSAPYYYGLLYGGSSSSPVSWPNWPNVEITDNIIEGGTVNQLIGLPGSGNNVGYISGSPLVARNYGVSAIYPTVSTPAMPASGTAQGNTYPYPVDVYISGGSATAVQVTRQGATYTVWSSSTATAIPPLLVRLEPGDSITITYSTAPSWTWVPAKANYGA